MRIARCPLTPRQFELFEGLARGEPRTKVARDLGIEYRTATELQRRGEIVLGARDLDHALNILDAAGWIIRADLPPAAFNYLKAFDAYLLAPRDARDQTLIRELCDAALEELLGDRPG